MSGRRCCAQSVHCPLRNTLPRRPRRRRFPIPSPARSRRLGTTRRPAGRAWVGTCGRLRSAAGTPRRWRRGRRLGYRSGSMTSPQIAPSIRRSGANAGPQLAAPATRRARRAGQGHLRGTNHPGRAKPEAEADLACAGQPPRHATEHQCAASIATARRNGRQDHSFARRTVRLKASDSAAFAGPRQAKRGENVAVHRRRLRADHVVNESARRSAARVADVTPRRVGLIPATECRPTSPSRSDQP